MRLTIDRKTEKKGLIKKTTLYVVDVSVEWTEEELAIVKERKLKDMALCDWPITKSTTKHQEEFGASQVHIFYYLPEKRKATTGSHAFSFDTPIDADNWEQKITGHIKEMKEYVYRNADAEEGTKTIDL